MKPTLEDYERAAAEWREAHDGVQILIRHHGANGSLCDGHGIWAYYLMIPEQMYPDKWDQFKCEEKDSGFVEHGPAFDRVDFHGGITYAANKPYHCRKSGRFWNLSKVGCDYAHAFDQDGGYWQGFGDVLHDARNSAAELVRAFPDRNFRCRYTGIWAPQAETYTANNGARVHESVRTRPGVSEHWLPRATNTKGS